MENLAILELGEKPPCHIRVAAVTFKLANKPALMRDAALAESDVLLGLLSELFDDRAIHDFRSASDDGLRS